MVVVVLKFDSLPVLLPRLDCNTAADAAVDVVVVVGSDAVVIDIVDRD